MLSYDANGKGKQLTKCMTHFALTHDACGLVCPPSRNSATANFSVRCLSSIKKTRK